MEMNEDMARRIARYLFTHKWLSAEYSEELENQLTEEILDAAELTNG
jgi:hypothetical protein